MVLLKLKIDLAGLKSHILAGEDYFSTIELLSQWVKIKDIIVKFISKL